MLVRHRQLWKPVHHYAITLLKCVHHNPQLFHVAPIRKPWKSSTGKVSAPVFVNSNRTLRWPVLLCVYASSRHNKTQCLIIDSNVMGSPGCELGSIDYGTKRTFALNMLTVSGICNSDADSCEHILTEQKEPRQSTKWQSSVSLLSGDEASLRYRVRVWRTVDKPAVCLARLTLASGGSCSWVWKTVHFSLWSHYPAHHASSEGCVEHGQWQFLFSSDGISRFFLRAPFWCILLCCISSNTISS